MTRNLLLSFAVAVAASLCLFVSTATAATAVPGALFHSDFADYGSDWHSLPHVVAPTITQLVDQVDAAASQPEGFGRFSTQTLINIGANQLEDLEIVLDLGVTEASSVDLWLAWFDSSGVWIDSTEVLRVTENPTETLVTSLAGIVAPVGWTDFHLLFFVREGAAIFDEVSLVPASSSAVPEPTTALLFGLGLVGFASVRRRRRHA